jgi:hypothetical protein
MSMDAGGLAQMTYNNFPSQGAIGMPTAGFASRGKGASLKRLSVASPPKVASISENEVQTPRTSRSHLLAGLRTAPKTPSSAQPPASAPYNQQQNPGANQPNRFARQNGPQTAIGSGFNANANQFAQQPVLYDQVLAPPPMQYDEVDMDPAVAAQLLATEAYLAQRQQQLQQQLLDLTAQQFGNMGLNGGMRQAQQFNNSYNPQMNAYRQQFQNTPLIQETGQPGVFLVYNQMTGQYQYVVDPSYQQFDDGNVHNLSHSPPPPTPGFASSPPKVDTPVLHVSPPNEVNPNPWSRSSSPPKKSSTPPQDVVPLPPPSANAFRRGHKKQPSSLAVEPRAETPEASRSAFARSAGFPATPMTGTFGPGQARAGEHPVRQPRGPPSIEELKASPTTKHEGSKNFATRQRRQALNNLVRAGMGRRGPRSIGSLRAVANGAIGSERQASKERSTDRASVSRSYSANSVSSDDGASIGGGLVEVRSGEQFVERRSTPKLVLTGVEKRKSTMF